MNAQEKLVTTVVAAVLAELSKSKVSEPVAPIEPAKAPSKRKSRSVRIAEANAAIRVERLAHGKKCACGRSMSKARTGTKVNGKVVCHYCWTHR